MFVIFLSDEGQEGCFLSVPRDLFYKWERANICTWVKNNI